MSEIKYKRVLLKLSGEAIGGEEGRGVDSQTLGKICDQIKKITELGVQVAIVVGGGNFWRGRYGHQIERTTSDYMGMLATAMNGLALQLPFLLLLLFYHKFFLQPLDLLLLFDLQLMLLHLILVELFYILLLTFLFFLSNKNYPYIMYFMPFYFR